MQPHVSSAAECTDINKEDALPASMLHKLFVRDDANNLVRHTTSPDHLVTLFKKVQSVGPYRSLIPVPDNYANICKELAERFPNFRLYIEEYLLPDLALERVSRGVIKLSPTLFVGPPGVGKTLFAEALASSFSLPFDRINLEASQAAFELVGSSRGWSNAQVGRLFQRLVVSKAPTNSLFALEELDKARGDERFPTAAALLQLLEPSTAKAFADQSAPELALDIRPTNFFFTANSTDQINDALLSRLVVIEIPGLTREESERVVVNQYRSLTESLGLGEAAPALSDEAVSVLSEHSPRRQRLLLRQAIGRAIAFGRQTIMLPKEPERREKRIGFL